MVNIPRDFITRIVSDAHRAHSGVRSARGVMRFLIGLYIAQMVAGLLVGASIPFLRVLGVI